MSGIIYRKNNANVDLRGSSYTEPNTGTMRLCVRDGNGNIVKYGFTTLVSASGYSPSFYVNGKRCYIGRIESSQGATTTTSSRQSTYTNYTYSTEYRYSLTGGRVNGAFTNTHRTERITISTASNNSTKLVVNSDWILNNTYCSLIFKTGPYGEGNAYSSTIITSTNSNFPTIYTKTHTSYYSYPFSDITERVSSTLSVSVNRNNGGITISVSAVLNPFGHEVRTYGTLYSITKGTASSLSYKTTTRQYLASSRTYTRSSQYTADITTQSYSNNINL